MHDFKTLIYTLGSSGVATVELDQPGTRNALSPEVLGELVMALAQARDDEHVRVVVLASSDEKVFSSGGNLAAFTSEVPQIQKHQENARFPELFRLLGELGKPSICAARGHVLAGAVGLALACDLVIASESARFGTPEINVGLFPFMVTALMYRNVPRKKAAELLLLGEQISATEAERIGLVNRVVPDEEFDDAVAEWAHKLASKSPLMLKLGKDAMFRQQDMDFADALELLRAQLTLAFGTEDVREGVAAFFEKREPEWRGR
ncbi:MAG TPA: enoyl-CoA hydratase-related protein [Solirubrobacteraceae bacterium]|nr:enoyl-CoA hydratase-related protein [Solirubrobacteraceae bacterium]